MGRMRIIRMMGSARCRKHIIPKNPIGPALSDDPRTALLCAALSFFQPNRLLPITLVRFQIEPLMPSI